METEKLKKALAEYELAGEPLSRETVNDLLKTLEKQTPKKPIKNEHSYNAYLCDCGHTVGVYDNNHIVILKAKYCSKCGQRIDWSEVEDE